MNQDGEKTSVNVEDVYDAKNFLSQDQIICPPPRDVDMTEFDDNVYALEWRLSIANDGSNFGSDLGLIWFDRKCLILKETEFEVKVSIRKV